MLMECRCKWGFGYIESECQWGPGQPNRGGYAWVYNKYLTFVIGIDGNQPTTFCGGYC
jgi:hypothetical protein